MRYNEAVLRRNPPEKLPEISALDNWPQASGCRPIAVDLKGPDRYA
jgi:hypothetical protein